MAEAPTSGFGLGSLTMDLSGIFAPTSTVQSTGAPATATSTNPTTGAPVDPALVGAIATGIGNVLNATLGAFGIGPQSAAAQAEAARRAAEASQAKMLAIGVVVASLLAVGFVLMRKPA